MKIDHNKVNQKSVFIQNMVLLFVSLMIAILMSSCSPSEHYKPDTLAQLNEKAREVDPNAKGLLSGEKGYFEITADNPFQK